MAEINITPLVDVMLVLLVIFMVTAPVISHPIALDLPQPGDSKALPSRPIELRIDATGEIYWNGAVAPLSALPAMLSAEAQRNPSNQPLLQIDASADAEYDIVAKVLAAAKNADLQKIAFVR